MSTSININYIESARVYLKLADPSTIVIRCCLCSTAGFTDWTLFLRHLTSRHAVGKCLANYQLELDEEIRAEVELEELNLNNIGNDELCADTDSDEEIPEIHVLDEQYLKPDIEDDKTQEQSENYVISKPNQPFYSMQHTKPELMHYFIDQLRQNEYLWNEDYRNMDFKTERTESAQEISQAIGEKFQVTLQPQIISYSVCVLLKWFRKQFAMSKNKSSFRPRYQTYYDKLLEFVPTKNIHMISCDECKRRFYNEDQLRRHKFHTHCGSQPYVCDVCNLGFSYACKLRMHRTRFHEKPSRWQCTLCSYCAPNKWDFRSHLRMHSGARNFTCELCGATTKSSSALAVHRRTHSAVKKGCPYCPKKYRENYLLKCHMKKMHAAQLEEDME